MAEQKNSLCEVLGIMDVLQERSSICANYAGTGKKDAQTPCYDSLKCNGICPYFEHRNMSEYNKSYGPKVSGADASPKLQLATTENIVDYTEEMDRASK